jgi:hypothetical protein
MFLARTRYQTLITICGLLTLLTIFSLRDNNESFLFWCSSSMFLLGNKGGGESSFDPFEMGAGSEWESFVHLKTHGRLGNQLFEYACSYSLARKHKIPLFLDVPSADPDFSLHRLHVPIPSDETRKRFLEKVLDPSSKVFRSADRNILSGEYPVMSIKLKSSFDYLLRLGE